MPAERPTMPEHVYYAAAVEWDRHSARPATGDITSPLRAAVESAYRAGRTAASQAIRTQVAEEIAQAIEALDAVDAALAGQHAWDDAARIARTHAVEATDAR